MRWIPPRRCAKRAATETPLGSPGAHPGSAGHRQPDCAALDGARDLRLQHVNELRPHVSVNTLENDEPRPPWDPTRRVPPSTPSGNAADCRRQSCPGTENGGAFSSHGVSAPASRAYLCRSKPGLATTCNGTFCIHSSIRERNRGRQLVLTFWVGLRGRVRRLDQIIVQSSRLRGYQRVVLHRRIDPYPPGRRISLPRPPPPRASRFRAASLRLHRPPPPGISSIEQHPKAVNEALI